MHTRKSKLGVAAALALGAVLLAPNQAFAAEYWLRAAATTVEMPDPSGTGTVAVPMWGYALCTANFAACSDPISVPGPVLSVPAADTTLMVHLRNDLTAPTSLVINGLFKAMAPVWTDGTSGPRGTDLSKRVRSFDAEATPSGGEQIYTWSSVKPGSYLYQSGTNPQVQVQMGLYGALAVDASMTTDATPRPQAYAGVPYDNQATLLYSEIDPAMHEAIGGAAPTYNTPAWTSTFNYAPKYFLVNGRPFPFGTPVISPTGNPGTTLLRMLNAGLTTRVPMIQGIDWNVIAEDGKPYAYSRKQYTALLPAAKTLDVLLTTPPDIGGGATYPIMDRRLGLSNAGLSDGGMLSLLRYGAQGAVGGGAPGNTPPTAIDDSFSTVVGVTLNVPAATGVLSNDTAGTLPTFKAVAASGSTTGQSNPVTTPPTYGTFALKSDGSFNYTPAPGFTGTDTFTYRATDGAALSDPPATVTINQTTPTAPTLGVIDEFAVAGSSLGANWSQQVSTTQTVPDIGVTGDNAIANTTALGGLAIWNAELGATQGAAVTGASTLEKSYLVLKASGGTTVAPANYVRVGCEGGYVVVATMMGGSNISVFVKQAVLGVCSGSSLSAVVDAKGLVTTFVGGAFAGGVQLPDVGAWKGGGRIGIQLQTQGATIADFSGGTL